jgi:Rod binding domain-containing protein
MEVAPALDPRLSAFAAQAQAATGRTQAGGATARLRAQAQDFESVFLSTMFQSMFTGIEGDGPMGSTTGVAPWRSFITQEYAKDITQKGGIGLTDQVYRELLARQESRAR